MNTQNTNVTTIVVQLCSLRKLFIYFMHVYESNILRKMFHYSHLLTQSNGSGSHASTQLSCLGYNMKSRIVDKSGENV